MDAFAVLGYGFEVPFLAGLSHAAKEGDFMRNHIRCNSPEMVRKELWTTLLTLLVTTTIVSASLMKFGSVQ